MLYSQTGFFFNCFFSGARGNVSNVKASDQIHVRVHGNSNKALAHFYLDNCIFTQLILRVEHAGFFSPVADGKTKGEPD